MYEVTNEDDNLLDYATQPPRRARIPLPCHLLVAQSARGVSGMAAADKRVEATYSTRPDAGVPDVLPYDLTTMKEDVMRCPACHHAMVSTGSHAFEDEKRTMTITRWRCRPCHETAEEIWLSTGYRGPDPTRIHYAAASRPAPQVTVPARDGNKRGTYAYAGVI